MPIPQPRTLIIAELHIAATARYLLYFRDSFEEAHWPLLIMRDVIVSASTRRRRSRQRLQLSMAVTFEK